MNKKYLILGALLLVGGYIAYKKFYVNKEEETDTKSSSDTTETPVSRGVVAPVETRLPDMVVSDTPSISIPNITTSTELVKNKLVTADNIATQSAPSGNFTYAGLGKY